LTVGRAAAFFTTGLAFDFWNCDVSYSAFIVLRCERVVLLLLFGAGEGIGEGRGRL
jgi:hypothetical protein